jgi:hypothetical protein
MSVVVDNERFKDPSCHRLFVSVCDNDKFRKARAHSALSHVSTCALRLAPLLRPVDARVELRSRTLK